MKIKFKSMSLWIALYIFIIIFLWGAVSYLKIVDSLLLPSPVHVALTGYKMLRSGELTQQIFISLQRILGGLFLGSILGLMLGSLCGISKKINRWSQPLLYLAYPIPRFALLPFIMLMFGVGGLSKIIFISLASFFPMTINTISGITSINENHLEAARHYGARGWKLYRRVILPGSIPSILSGIRIGIGTTVATTTAIEFLTSTDGLGAMIWLSLQSLRTDKMFLGVIFVASINLLAVYLLSVIEKIITPWNNQHEVVPADL